MRHLTIKLRMTVWFTLFMLTLSVLMLVFIMLMSRDQVSGTPEAEVVKVVERNIDRVDIEHSQLDLHDVDFYRREVYTQIFLDDGTLLAGARPSGVREELALQAGSVRTARGETESYYVYDSYLSLPTGGLWVRGTIAQSAQRGVMAVIVPLAWILLPGLLLLSALGGWLICRLSFRPMEKLIDEVEHIGSGDDLSRRLGLKPGRNEVNRLACAFDAMLDRLERSFEAERQFTADASHELRTPVAVILAECDTLGEQPDADDCRSALEVIRAQAQHMSALISRLLSIARLEQGTQKLQSERADLSELVRVTAEVQERIAPRGIHLCCTADPDIVCELDVTLISRLLSNLLSNAFRYSRDGGTVDVSLRREGDEAVLSVADDGPGIPPEQQETIFRRFYQSDASHAREGAGLGLFMVRQIARLHGGEVQVESTVGAGSTFIVRLPLK